MFSKLYAKNNRKFVKRYLAINPSTSLRPERREEQEKIFSPI